MNCLCVYQRELDERTHTHTHTACGTSKEGYETFGAIISNDKTT